MSQTVVNDGQSMGVAGQLSDVGHRDIISLRNSLQIVPFGRAIDKVVGSENAGQLPISGGVLEGVALRDLPISGAVNAEQYPVDSPMNVAKKGRVVVDVEEVVSGDDAVYVRFDGKSQVQTITLDIDLEASNVIDMDVDGVAMTQVPWNASHNQTMTDICTQLTTDFPQIATATAALKVITITAAVHGTDVAITDFLVTLGSNQAVGTIAETVASVLDTERGKFRNDADSGTCRLLTNARFMDASDNGLVRLDLTVT